MQLSLVIRLCSFYERRECVGVLVGTGLRKIVILAKARLIIECNKQIPTIKTLVIITDYLGISLDDLIKKAEFRHRIIYSKNKKD